MRLLLLDLILGEEDGIKAMTGETHSWNVLKERCEPDKATVVLELIRECLE